MHCDSLEFASVDGRMFTSSMGCLTSGKRAFKPHLEGRLVDPFATCTWGGIKFLFLVKIELPATFHFFAPYLLKYPRALRHFAALFHTLGFIPMSMVVS